jgi:hypothetical protein
MSLEHLTDQELQAELERRQLEREQAAARARQDRFVALVEHREALLALVPHGRTSCSDENPVNGISVGTRCNRCALLEVTEFDFQYYDFDLTLNFRYLPQE